MDDLLHLLTLSDALIESARWNLRGRPRLLEWHSHWQAPAGPDEPTPAPLAHLAAFLEEQNIREGSAVLLIPTRWAALRHLNFPFSEPAKIRQALPFALSSEVLHELDAYRYSFSTHRQTDAPTEVRVQLIAKDLLDAIQHLFQERDLTLRDVRTTACALQALPDEATFQIYVGPDEVFANSREGALWQAVQTFSSRLDSLTQPHTAKGLQAFLHALGRSGGTHGEADEWAPLRQELMRLAGEFTRFLRLQSALSESEVRFYGIFAPFFQWDGVLVRLRAFPVPEAEQLASSPPSVPSESASTPPPENLKELIHEAESRERAEQESGTALVPRVDERGVAVASGSLLDLQNRQVWSLLEDLKREVLPGSHPKPLGLLTETPPWKRFAKRHRKSLLVAALLGGVLLSLQVGKLVLRQELLRQELQLTESSAQQLLRQVGIESTALREGVLELRDRISKRQIEIEVGQSYLKREYTMLQFLNNLSGLIDAGPTQFQIDRVEYTTSRFALNGLIDSYDRLQELKSRLTELEAFAGKRIVESNRKSSEGIVFRISIDL